MDYSYSNFEDGMEIRIQVSYEYLGKEAKDNKEDKSRMLSHEINIHDL